MSLPSIQATGRLGDDPELRFTPGGKAVADFRIACDENKKNGDQWEKVSTTWLRVSIWERDAEAVAEHVKKGDLVTVIGSLTVREYDKKDGGKGTSVEIKNATVSKALPRVGAVQPSSSWQQPAPAQTNTTADPWSTQPALDDSTPPF
jgi:single-strand DNA-binding protein